MHTKIVVCALTGVTALALAACGSSTKQSISPPPTTSSPSSAGTASTPPTPQSTSTGVPTSGTVVYPTLTVGKTTQTAPTMYDKNGNTVGGDFTVTLLAARASGAFTDNTGYTYTPDPGTKFLCLQLKIVNSGQAPASVSDFDGAGTQWTGKDGRVADTSLATITCNSIGVGNGNDDINADQTLNPGQYVVGTVRVEVPSSEPGVLQFRDDTETTFLGINY